MSRPYEGWPSEPPHSAPRPLDPAQQTDQTHQRIRLPPPTGLLSGAPSSPGDYYPQHRPPSNPPVPQQQFAHPSVPPPTAPYSQPPGNATYHNYNYNTNQHVRNYHDPHAYQQPYALPPTPRDGYTGYPGQTPAETPQQHYGPPRQYHPIHPQPAHHPYGTGQMHGWEPATPSSMGQTQPGVHPSTPSSMSSKPKPRSSDIPNLLNGGKPQAVQSIRFNLIMRQQPKAARACGSGERDRRNIDPPPIVQLEIDAPPELDSDDINKYLRYEGYVMSCWIYDETGSHDASHMPSEYRYQRRLTGSLVGTPFYGKDENGQFGCFFPFSDLSVRTLGKYRLKFNLIMLDTSLPGQNTHFPILTEIFSDVFDVYTAKEFPGINESSKLVRTLREQGCIIAIKKGNDKKKRLKGLGERSDDEDENMGEDDEGTNPQGKRMRGFIEP